MGKVFAAGIAAIFVKGFSLWFSGTVAEVRENGVRSVFNDGGKWCGGRAPFCGNE